MSHACKALILHCIDFRFGNAIKKYLEEKSLLGDCDIVSVAGAAKNLSSPANESDREFILRQIDVSKQLHRISTVILMNHTDCGAYGGRQAFASEEAERSAHIEELKRAKEIILKKYPELEIPLVLATINPEGDIGFEEIRS